MENVEKVLPDIDEIPPYDPITENARVMAGGPIKVFGYQDHDAQDIGTYSPMNNPEMAQNPLAKQTGQLIVRTCRAYGLQV